MVLQATAENRIWQKNLRAAATQHQARYQLSGALHAWRDWSFTAIRRWEERLIALVSPVKESSPPTRKRPSLTTREMHAAGIVFAAVKARRSKRLWSVIDSFKTRANYGRKLDRVRAMEELKCNARGAKHWLHNRYRLLLRLRDNCRTQAEAQHRMEIGLACRRHRALTQAFTAWRDSLRRFKRGNMSFQAMKARGYYQQKGARGGMGKGKGSKSGPSGGAKGSSRGASPY